MIRKFNKSKDIDLIVEGEVEAHTNSFPGTEVPLDLVTARVRSFRRPGTRCIVLDENGPKGYVVASRTMKHGRFEIYIESVYVVPELRGKGKVEMLFNALLEQSADNTITLDVSVTNESAVRAYQALGFETARYRMSKDYPAGGNQEDKKD